MRKRLLTLAGALGMTGCGMTATDEGMCIAQRADMERLRAALLAHPETPDAVGEAGADVVIGFRAGCRA